MELYLHYFKRQETQTWPFPSIQVGSNIPYINFTLKNWDSICGLSLLLVLVPSPRVFVRALWFSSLHKKQYFQIQIRAGNGERRATRDMPLKFPFIYLFLGFILHLSY